MSNNSTNVTLSELSLGYNDTNIGIQADLSSISNVTMSFLYAIEEQKRNGATQAMFLFQYSTSIYGVTCLFMALLLNRTMIMASTNANQTQRDDINRSRGLGTAGALARTIKKVSTVFFRLMAISVLVYNIYTVLVALNLHGHIAVSGDLPFFYKLIPDKYFAYSPKFFSFDRYMATPKRSVMIGPSSDMYWPIFLSYCLLTFVETFISSIEGKRIMTETGITIFEHSLAFRYQSIGTNIRSQGISIPSAPTEQMLISCLFLLINHLIIHIGSLINDNKYRLIALSVSGLSFLAYIILTVFEGTFFQFPNVFVVIFIPQLMMLFIFAISVCIFLLAIVFNNLSLDDLNCASIFTRTYEEDEESEDTETSIFGTRIDLSEDFYSAFSKFVVLVVNIAGKTSYIKELSLIPLDNQTWVERSIWDAIGSLMGSSVVDKKAARSALAYLRENGINGYSNMILSPSKRLTLTSNNNNYQAMTRSTSIFKSRYLTVKHLLTNLISLIYGIIIHKIMRRIVPGFIKNLFFLDEIFDDNDLDESDESFEYRKKLVPGFLAKFTKRRFATNRSSPKPTLAIDQLSNDELEEKYLTLLNGVEISEIDNSDDFYNIGYDDDDLESVMESDAESIDGSIYGSSNAPPLYELLGNDGVGEFVNTSSLHVLLDHIDYNGEGRLTRSKVQSIVTSTAPSPRSADSDLEKLVQLLLEKRANSSENTAHEESIDSKFDCVICQTNTREIITWPCKCFAICDDCRMSLIAKGMEGCVCCRRDVEGVSKVFLP